MIDNIKQFVNEHRTLIAVIITVLVIYFLYILVNSRRYPFFVLNELGEGEMFKNNQFFVAFQEFFDNFSTRDCILKTMLKGPSYFLADNWKMKIKFNKLGPKMFGQISNDDLRKTIMSDHNFNIETYLSSIAGFDEAYSELIKVFNCIGNVSSVDLIGQLAVKPTTNTANAVSLVCSPNEKNQLNGNFMKFVKNMYGIGIVMVLKNNLKSFVPI